MWLDALCFVEVKNDPYAGPYRDKDAPTELGPFGPIPVVSQAANYARLHISCRPFQLFSIGVIIFASGFTVSVFDRGGVMHSPQMKVFDDHGITSDFIRVVRLLSTELTEQEFGLDPTVTLLPAGDVGTLSSYAIGFTPRARTPRMGWIRDCYVLKSSCHSRKGRILRIQVVSHGVGPRNIHVPGSIGMGVYRARSA